VNTWKQKASRMKVHEAFVILPLEATRIFLVSNLLQISLPQAGVCSPEKFNE